MADMLEELPSSGDPGKASLNGLREKVRNGVLQGDTIPPQPLATSSDKYDAPPQSEALPPEQVSAMLRTSRVILNGASTLMVDSPNPRVVHRGFSQEHDVYSVSQEDGSDVQFDRNQGLGGTLEARLVSPKPDGTTQVRIVHVQQGVASPAGQFEIVDTVQDEQGNPVGIPRKHAVTGIVGQHQEVHPDTPQVLRQTRQSIAAVITGKRLVNR